jgi:hypothetical protein
MEYKYYRNGVWEVVDPVLWQWEVVYRNGTNLFQYDSKGIFHQIKEIDQKELLFFAMRNYKTNQNFRIYFPEGASLIHEYLTRVNFYKTPQEQTLKAFVFGYTLDDKSIYYVITPKNDLVVLDDINRIELFSGTILSNKGINSL